MYMYASVSVCARLIPFVLESILKACWASAHPCINTSAQKHKNTHKHGTITLAKISKDDDESNHKQRAVSASEGEAQFVYVMLYHIMSCHVMLSEIVLCCVVLRFCLLCHAMLCYVMLCCLVLCYVMLCYVMLWYVMI